MNLPKKVRDAVIKLFNGSFHSLFIDMNFWPHFSQGKKGGGWLHKEGVEGPGIGGRGVNYKWSVTGLFLCCTVGGMEDVLVT